MTDSYIAPGIDEVRAAVNRAARPIDCGAPPSIALMVPPRRRRVLVFRSKTAHQTAQQVGQQSQSAKKPKVTTRR